MASFVRNFMAGLSPREAKLVVAMGLVIVLMGFSLTLFFLSQSTAENERKTDEYSELINLVKLMEPDFAKLRTESEKPVSSEKPMPLRTLVEKSVEKVGLTAPDTKELNDKTHATGWLEQSSEVSFRQIELEPLVQFMEQIETYKPRFPIAITKLKIRKQRRQQSMYNVTMTITTYEKNESLAIGKGKKGGAK